MVSRLEAAGSEIKDAWREWPGRDRALEITRPSEFGVHVHTTFLSELEQSHSHQLRELREHNKWDRVKGLIEEAEGRTLF